jgi:hypothetical protein
MGEFAMRLTTGALKSLILEVLSEEKDLQYVKEAKMEDLSDVCYVGGSTHQLATCKIGEDKYYLKFSDSWAFSNPTDKSMQIGVEYLAYKIYQLYPANVPQGVEVVSDPQQKRIGLATAEMKGQPAGDLRHSFPAKDWVSSISGGAMVDIFLANWDVKNTNNFVVDTETAIASRVDPGGSLTFRAQGGRKGDRFSGQAGEIKTMMDPNMRGGAGWLLSQVDMKKACEAFLSVSWPEIQQAIMLSLGEVSRELKNAGLSDQMIAWQDEVKQIMTKLETRHADVKDHCEHTLSEM